MYSTLIVLSFSLAFILYNIVNLPFKSAIQNYRSNFIHICQLIVLLTANYYRSMKATTPLEIKGYIFWPAILQLVLIVMAVAFSILFLAWEIKNHIKKMLDSKKIKNKEKKE